MYTHKLLKCELLHTFLASNLTASSEIKVTVLWSVAALTVGNFCQSMWAPGESQALSVYVLGQRGAGNQRKHQN